MQDVIFTMLAIQAIAICVSFAIGFRIGRKGWYTVHIIKNRSFIPENKVRTDDDFDRYK